MKSKRAKEFIGDTYLVGHPAFPIRIDIKNDLVKAVELAEQDHYRKELEESKRREELARKVIDDQRKKIEALKARAADAFKEYMEQAHGGYLTSDLDNFIQKFNER